MYVSGVVALILHISLTGYLVAEYMKQMKAKYEKDLIQMVKIMQQLDSTNAKKQCSHGLILVCLLNSIMVSC